MLQTNERIKYFVVCFLCSLWTRPSHQPEMSRVGTSVTRERSCNKLQDSHTIISLKKEHRGNSYNSLHRTRATQSQVHIKRLQKIRVEPASIKRLYNSYREPGSLRDYSRAIRSQVHSRDYTRVKESQVHSRDYRRVIESQVHSRVYTRVEESQVHSRDYKRVIENQVH